MSLGGSDESKPSTSTPTTPKGINPKAKKMHIMTPSDDESPHGNKHLKCMATDKQEVPKYEVPNENLISIINDPHTNKALARRRKSDKLYFDLTAFILQDPIPGGAKERGTWVEKLRSRLKRMVESMKNFVDMGQTPRRDRRRRPGSSCPRVYSGIWR